MTLHKKRKSIILKAVVAVLSLSLMLTGCGNNAPDIDNSGDAPQSDFTSVPEGAAANTVPGTGAASLPYKAVWISYLDFTAFDTASEQSFRQSAQTVFDNCVNLGLNTVIFQVRPFSDAIYKSDIYPYSHILTGEQGKDPGYDPLAILIEEAHARNLLFEAWVNPYRISLNANLPANIASTNPATLNPDWVREVGDGLYFDPSIPEVQQLIIDGTLEIINNYDVDAIQFDDYFYPTTDASFDEEQFALLGGDMSLDAWRRQNVNTLVQNVYAAIKAADPTCVFGISPQGNNDNNYNSQYSDVQLWLSQPGYVDYIMPQIYWGFDYRLSNGSDRFAFENCTNEWLSYERHEDVALAIGLGAFRIAVGDGGSNDQSEWNSGQNIAKMVKSLEGQPNVDGFALFRYQNLFDNTNEYQESERLALTDELHN